MKPLLLPEIHWFYHYQRLNIDKSYLENLVYHSFSFLRPRYPSSSLPKILDVSFVSKRKITLLHQDFCNDPTPTDVITFLHDKELGEIILGVPVIASYAQEYHHSLEEEIALCIIHGILHLLNYDDLTDNEKVIMHAHQEEVLKKAKEKILISVDYT